MDKKLIIMKVLAIFMLVTCATYVSYSQNDRGDCTNCSNGVGLPQGSVSSRVGLECNAFGNNSFSGGWFSTTATSAISSFAFGYRCQANAPYSIALGFGSEATGDKSIAFGVQAKSIGASAKTFGNNVTGLSPNTITMGRGYDESHPLVNFKESSLIVGFKSDSATLFVGPSPVGLGNTGRIGIGTMYPEAKVHIRSCRNEEAILMVQPQEWITKSTATIQLGTPEFDVKANFDLGLLFHSPRNYYFMDGKVGIGDFDIHECLTKVHIRSQAGEPADLFIEPSTWESTSSAEFYLGTMDYSIKAVADQGLVFNSDSNYIFRNGNVGIGVDYPATKLDVGGIINSFAIETEEISVLNNSSEWASIIENQHMEGKGLLVKAGTYSYNNPVFEVQDKDGNSILYAMANQGKIGIGTINPQSKLDVAGPVRMTGFQLTTNPVEGYVLTSNSSGFATWTNPELSYYWQKNQYDEIYRMSNVGINIQNPAFTLDVEGNIGIKEYIIGKSNSPNDALLFFGSELATSPNIEIGRGSTKKGIKLVCADAVGDIQMHFGGIPAVSIMSTVANFGTPSHVMDMNVNGKIEAVEVEIMVDVWQDQVFQADYPLMDLNDLEKYSRANHHLPDVPSESEVLSNGINLGETNAILLKKIEELTLYVIELKKENKDFQNQLNSLLEME